MADQTNKFAVPWWVLIVIGAAWALVFIRFCTKDARDKNDTVAMQLKHLEDSTRMAREAELYKQEFNAAYKRVLEAEGKYKQADSNLKSVIAQNKLLIKNRRQLVVNPTDTNQTIVPQEFIDDCEGCFTQLAKTNDSAIAYQQEVEALRMVMQAQNSADSQRIVQLERDKLALNKDYNDARIAAEINLKSMEPRRKVKTGLAIPFNNSFLPNGVGAGVMYQDKKDRNFGIEALFGKQPPLYVARMYVPFSLRN